MKREPYDPEKLEHNDAPPLALSDWQRFDDCSGDFATMVEGDFKDYSEEDCDQWSLEKDLDWSIRDELGDFGVEGTAEAVIARVIDVLQIHGLWKGPTE